MIETSYKLSPVSQPGVDEDYYLTLQVAPIKEPPEGTLLSVHLSIHGGEPGTLKEICSVELSPSEAEELGSVLKVVADPEGIHDQGDLLNAGKVLT
jgi:hypothetical protein